MIIEDMGYFVECTPTAILASRQELGKHKIAGYAHFYVVFTPDSFLLSGDYLNIASPGYSATFFTSMSNLPQYGWDIVLYDSETHEALAKIEWREHK